MDGNAIARMRMRGLGLWGTPLASPVAVVGRLLAMQAQEYSFALWSVGQRAAGADLAAVARAVDDGSILRTHVLRPTWHVVLPADIRWLLALTGPRVKARMAAGYRRLGLDDRTVARSNEALADALRGGAHLTRHELGAALRRRRIDPEGQRLPYLLMSAELDAVICSGARRGRHHTYALLEERVPRAGVLDPEEALAELVRRYVLTRGPATVKDLAWWSSLPMGELRRGIEMLGPAVERRDADGRTYWLAARSTVQRARPAAVDLVQVYDEALMSYTESRDAVTGSASPSIREAQRAIMHAVLLDGQLTGRWRRQWAKERTVVEVTLERRPDERLREGLTRATRRYGRFVGAPVELRIR